MQEILLVEDSQLLSGLISQKIAQELSRNCLTRSNSAETAALLEERGEDILLAVLDLNLPAAGIEEIVAQLTGRGIPVIVLTDRVDDEVRDRMVDLRVFDYILKGPYTLDLLCSAIRRYLRNIGISILIVDDSRSARAAIAGLLATQYFTTIEAGDGVEALGRLREEPTIRLLLTDFHMPRMDGFELLGAVRTRYSMEQLAIIGLSGRGSQLLSSQFLKCGANDFLSKPYFDEELIWRVNQNLEMLDHIQTRHLHQQQLKQIIAEQTAKIQESQAMVVQQEKLAAIGQLAAGVAHEINNPIGFITSNLRTLHKYLDRTDSYLKAVDNALDGLPAAARTALATLRSDLKIDQLSQDLPELVNDCLNGTERMQKIVLGLKGFARKDDGQRQLTNINQCIEDAITIAWNELKYKARLERDFGDLPETCGYPQLLSQVFMNLLVNAAHAIDSQGVIGIVTRCHQGQIEVEISDTGCGIPADRLEKIFEPFFTTKQPGQGTGLGMGIAREIVLRHEGKIEVASEVGNGTTIKLILPVIAASAAVTACG